jgi:hypothetical protein
MIQIGRLVIPVLAWAAIADGAPQETVLVEAEGFQELGGWVVDQQFMDQMGSPFLLAHGLGKPVADAVTTVAFPAPGPYAVWVRTRDWVGPWKKAGTPPSMKAAGSPGRFQVLVNGKPLEAEFGAEGAEWHWQQGGAVRIDAREARLALHDLTGFDGRCDAIVFSADPAFTPPPRDPELAAFRRQRLGIAEEPAEGGPFDLVVAGGGMAGTCAAVAAARCGLRVALVHDRPVLGGNNSSEVRVHLGGGIQLRPYPAIGALVKELDPHQSGNAQPAAVYRDDRKLEAARAEKRLALFLGSHVNGVERDGARIRAVVAQDVRSGARRRFEAPLFADCTGDGTVGFLAGADHRVGREARGETGETMAPEQADALTMGTSVMWYAVDDPSAPPFPETPWALQFTAKSCPKTVRGDWNWETGMGRHQVDDFEAIRDYGLRAAYGAWSFLKNASPHTEEFSRKRLDWVAYIGGKRESRRLLGDVILNERDVLAQKEFPDACVTTTWTIDLHVPAASGFEGDPFRSTAKHTKVTPYAIPYRCLYSRNVENLFMAGRNISVTHVALGTVRVMRTTGMMGEVVGLAAAVARKRAAAPRDVYEKHLDEFKALLKQGVPPAGR